MAEIKNSDNIKCWQRNWITHISLVGMKNGITTLENSLIVSYKAKRVIIIQPSNCTLGLMFTQKSAQECLNPKPETAQMFFSE